MPIVALSALLHLYLAWRLVPAWSAWPVAAGALAALLLASAIVMPLAMRARRFRSPGWATAMTWAGFGFLGLFSSLLVLTLLRDLGLGAAALLHAAVGGFDLERLALRSGQAVPLLALVATLWGFLNARRTASVVDVEVPIAGLPAALHGFTIAQISDIHVGPTIGRGYLDAIVQAVNRLDVDLVAVTGDLVDGRVADLAEHVAPLASLRSRHGTYFVTGNHEYYSGAPAWIAELRRLGVRVLLNEHVVLSHGEAALLLAGVTDHGAHHFDPAQRSDPEAALAGAPAEARVRVLLAHQPRSAEAAERAGFQLQLSGHTHGGQFWPWNHFVRFQQPFTSGLHRWRGLWVYVSRGTGYWGPPKRLGAPSEITRVRLVPS
ncbi:MAG TPA: metallophosphoesterase [Albitalea sp.]|uniref:metallophosphoesterase n=1 Tax=Piscinibacter sp. TaxID=1903157 RepID=UPI002ED06795